MSDYTEELAEQIIEEEFAKFIATRLGIAEATGLDVEQIRGLHLAEPHLPATAATKRLVEAGLLP